LRPTTIGGWNVESPNFIAQREISYPPGGRKFEPGAYTHSVLAGLRGAVELLLEVGQQKITDQIRALTQSLRDQIAPAGFEFLSPIEEKNRSGILTFRHPRVSSDHLAEALSKNDIVVSLRFDRAERSWLRVSPHFYNTLAEIQRMAEILLREVSG
jgi:cysteine desulfurase/selenocysteine lyase